MMQLPLQPDQILKEAIDFNRKLAGGMLGLREVGDVEVGVTPKEEVYREDKMVLYHYKPTVDKPAKTPLLIVYALVNRPYMTDLQEDRSTVRNLLDHGEDVYRDDEPQGSVDRVELRLRSGVGKAVRQHPFSIN